MLVFQDKQFEIYGNKLFGNLYKERETKFFIVKSANMENVELAMEKKMWFTSKVNEIRFNEAFTVSNSAILIHRNLPSCLELEGGCPVYQIAMV